MRSPGWQAAIREFRTGTLIIAVPVILLVLAVFLLPYVWTVASGLKPQQAIFRDLSPIGLQTFVPFEPTFANIRTLFAERQIARALLNSAIVSGLQVLGTVVLCSLAAYGLTRVRMPGGSLILALVLATFMVPYEALVIPMFSLMSGLGLQDSLVAVFLPWIASPFGLFLLRPAFEEVPRELDEAARIDGAGHLRIFWSVILPNVRTALLTLSLVTFLFSWNAFLWPLIVLHSPEKAVVQIAIAQSVAPGQLPNWGETFAGATVASLPLILVFLVLQRHFVRGMANSGLK